MFTPLHLRYPLIPLNEHEFAYHGHAKVTIELGLCCQLVRCQKGYLSHRQPSTTDIDGYFHSLIFEISQTRLTEIDLGGHLSTILTDVFRM
jgi:hypothetical protein